MAFQEKQYYYIKYWWSSDNYIILSSESTILGNKSDVFIDYDRNVFQPLTNQYQIEETELITNNAHWFEYFL